MASPISKKNGRFSWSGEPIAKINQVNRFGTTLTIDENHHVVIVYHFSKDQRPNKNMIIPEAMQKDDLLIAKWNNDFLRKKVEDKFNQNGWFKCERDSAGIYHQIVFGDPLNFENWLKLVEQGIVFFDSGMYEGNARNYSQWRANNSLWESLVVRRYD